MDRNSTCFQARSLGDGLGMCGLVLQNERVKDRSANNTAPPDEGAGPRIVLPVGKDLPHHDVVATLTVHEADCVVQSAGGKNPGLA